MENLKVSVGGKLERALSFPQAFKRIGTMTLFLLVLFYPFLFPIHYQKVFSDLTHIFIISHGLFTGITEKVKGGVFVNVRER